MVRGTGVGVWSGGRGLSELAALGFGLVEMKWFGLRVAGVLCFTSGVFGESARGTPAPGCLGDQTTDQGRFGV